MRDHGCLPACLPVGISACRLDTLTARQQTATPHTPLVFPQYIFNITFWLLLSPSQEEQLPSLLRALPFRPGSLSSKHLKKQHHRDDSGDVTEASLEVQVLQRRLMGAVTADPKLKALAADAFRLVRLWLGAGQLGSWDAVGVSAPPPNARGVSLLRPS